LTTGGTITKFTAYEASYTGGVRVALGDVTGDGIPEIITAPGRNHAPLVKVFDLRTGAELSQYEFLAYGAKYLGGVSLAVGDVNGDGVSDIVTAPSVGVAQVHVYVSHVLAGGGFVLTRNFNAFADHPGLSMRATIAVGDIDGARDGNSRADIVVASGVRSP